jgi:RecB family exonuclease
VLCDFYTKLSADDRTEDALIGLFDDGWRALSAGYHRIPDVGRHYDASIAQLRNYVAHFDWRAEPYLVEPYIEVDLAPGVRLFGRPDRLDQNPDGTLHVIDYKGGALPGDVDPSQILFYAVMVEIRLERRVTAGSFWYLDDGSRWTLDLSEADKQDARDELLEAIDEMNGITDYPPTIAPHCAGCPYLQGCAVRSEIAEIRQKEGW